jgi:hypothetical protein
MDQNPYKTDSVSVTQNIPYILYNPVVQCRLNNSLWLEANLTPFSPINALPLSLCIILSVILTSSSTWHESLSLRFFLIKCYFFICSMHSTCPTHLIILRLIAVLIFVTSARYKASQNAVFSLHPVVQSSPLSLINPPPLLSTLFLNTVYLWPSPRVIYQVRSFISLRVKLTVFLILPSLRLFKRPL